LAALAAALLAPRGDASTDIDSTCQTGADPSVKSGSDLNSFTSTKNGVVWESSGAQLQLQKQAGVFTGTVLGVSVPIFSGCAADFDEDGWTDFVATGQGANSYIKTFKNETYQNAEPSDWNDATKIRTPKFTTTTQIEAANSSYDAAVMGCADLNGDGHQDFVYIRCTSSGCTTPTRSDVFLGNGHGAFAAPYKMVATGNESKIGPIGWTTNSIAFADYNKDGKLDIVMGTNAGTGGALKVLLNDGGSSPKFDQEVYLAQNMGYGARGSSAIAVADYNGDGVPDYIVGGPATNWLRLYPGLLGGGIGTYQSLQVTGYTGGATAILSGNFTLSGKTSILVGSDGLNGYTGGKVFAYENTGTSTPFTTVKQTISTGSSDLDLGWAFDYDHDPDRTLDFVMADGNNSASYYLYANRTLQKYVTCGTTSSDPVDIGELASTEMTVTSVRIAPTPATPTYGTVTWEASNDDGASWHPALACADDPTKYCAALTTTNGSKIRWRATLCSNTNAPANTKTPTISSVSTSYTYVTATNHFRAGPIARDGLIYVGAFRMPGNVGHVYAMSDESGTTQWDASTKLDAQAASARKIYTADANNNRLDFSTANASSTALQSTLLVGDATAATTLIDWFFSGRFGLYAPLHVLGSIENSTPALLTPPAKPYWYDYVATPQSERQAVDDYLTAYASRPQLLFVGSRDGALHAFYTNPSNVNDANLGKEMWGFVPNDVAQRLLSDKTAGTSTAYPDGSPTLVSAKVNGRWRTVLLSGEANGGRAVYALDVTDTVTATSTVGPTPLWQFQDANMGRTYSKPTVVRTKVNGVETWMAVFASGPGATTDVGDSVYAVDLSTGALVWRFDLNDTNTYISTDITASETNDESGATLDGYIDRVFFADNKGRVWKLDPSAFNADTHTIAPVGSSLDVGLGVPALFSTRLTAGALGEDRAIAGTLTAVTDATNKLVLYFGTGGTEDTPDTVQNGFYAVYADTGTIRSKLDFGTGILIGVKFYGGVVYNSGQLVLTNGRDFGQHGLCSSTAGNVVALDANTFALQFSTPTTSKIVAPVFARNGEIYTVTLTGQLVASTYQGGTASPSTSTSTGPYSQEAQEWGHSDTPMKTAGWRQY
jgi:hypothetical protein